ncbi:MAG: glycosyltransferase [Acidobacteria bacterium]|nr:glycosyltransferase [Acidobacteriota bacterium]
MPDVIRIPRSDAPRVSIVIPSAAKPELLVACLRSLERHLPASIPTETIVVLDGAPEGAAARIERSAPGALVVSSSVRLGLARAANRGRRRARGEFLALLHDDSEIDAGWLEALVAAAEAHPEAGAFGGLVLFPDGTPQSAGVVPVPGGARPPWAGPPPAGRRSGARVPRTSAPRTRSSSGRPRGTGRGDSTRVIFLRISSTRTSRCPCGGRMVRPFRALARNRHRRGASSRRDFREWVSGRNRSAFRREMEGDALEVRALGRGSPESIDRARRARRNGPPRAWPCLGAGGDLLKEEEGVAARSGAPRQDPRSREWAASWPRVTRAGRR